MCLWIRARSLQSQTSLCPPQLRNCGGSWHSPTSASISSRASVPLASSLITSRNESNGYSGTMQLQDQAFSQLKKAFTTVPILRHPDLSHPFIVEVVAGTQELLAVKLVLEKWHHWLEGALHPFMIYTNHKNIEYLKSAKRLNSHQVQWALFFTWFNFTLSYYPESKNTKADSLSCLYPSPTL